MKQAYSQSVQLIERLHRRFLDVINTELERLKIDDINNVQALILYNISGEELTIGELTNRGFYLGSNVSYNVKKLVENGFITQEKALHDKRSVRIKLSAKGQALCQRIDELYQRNSDALSKEMNENILTELNRTLEKIESFWTNYINNCHRLPAH